MFQSRRVLLPAVFAGFAAIFLSVPARSVQAGANSGSALRATQIFDQRSLPSFRQMTLLRAGTAEMPQSAQDVPLPDGKGRDLTQQKCNMCHVSTVWMKKHYTQDQWSSVIDQMVGKGMIASDEEIATMSSYLATNFGPEKRDAPPAPSPPQQ